jgi:hypothetical protein
VAAHIMVRRMISFTWASVSKAMEVAAAAKTESAFQGRTTR